MCERQLWNMLLEIFFKTSHSWLDYKNIIFPLQARGIDVQQVSLVINYDLPTNRENYIHR